jgi:Sperm-tail PG-rich repeat
MCLFQAPNVYTIPTILGHSKEGTIRSAPAYTILGRHKQKPPQCVQFPGPGTYDSKIDYLVPKPPIYSMGSRLNVPSDSLKKPGPSVYAPEQVRACDLILEGGYNFILPSRST